MADASPSTTPQVSPSSKAPQSRVSFQSGDWIQIRSAEEILATLDENGMLDGLPLMPEMLPFCGRKYRVERMAGKACVQGEGVYIGRLKDCVTLLMRGRCDGAAHGGCEMGCKFYWKQQWVTPTIQPDGQNDQESPAASLMEKKKWLEACAEANTEGDSPRYICQSTQLVQIATPTSPFKLAQYVDDYRKDGIGLGDIAGFLISLVGKKLLKRSDNLAGPNKHRTPVDRLNLQVGQGVRVKSLDEIQATLDLHGCNRGLWFDKDEMGPFCGKSLIVTRRVTKLIDEKTGKLKALKQPAIVLAESECSGIFRRFCSRGMLHFWREVWLETE